MRILIVPTAFLLLLVSAALCGFFYAWVCSTLWGLDAADPRVAIAAMQAMNASVRNAVFAPVFFGTPVMLALAAFAAMRGGYRSSARAFALAAAVTLILVLGVTAAMNVPMNKALAAIRIPDDIGSAREIWQSYSQPWQRWNLVRSAGSAIAFLLAATGVYAMGRDHGKGAAATQTPPSS